MSNAVAILQNSLEGPQARTKASGPAADEFLVRTQLQAQELWIGCAAFEAADLVNELDGDDISGALEAADRVVRITRCLREQVRLLSALPPPRLRWLRRRFGAGDPGSTGTDRATLAANAAWAALERLLARRRSSVFAIYYLPDRNPGICRLLERFVDWDAALQSWLAECSMLAGDVGAGGARVPGRIFPELWKVRAEIHRVWPAHGA